MSIMIEVCSVMGGRQVLVGLLPKTSRQRDVKGLFMHIKRRSQVCTKLVS